MSVHSISPSQLAQNQLAAPQARQLAPGQDSPKVEAERRAAETAASEQIKPGGTEQTKESTPPAAVDRQELERALENVRRVVEPVAHNLQFVVDEDTGRTVVKVVDGATDEVIRQIPSEEILSIAKALDKLSGLLIEQKA